MAQFERNLAFIKLTCSRLGKLSHDASGQLTAEHASVYV